jgi:hypothetical protein
MKPHRRNLDIKLHSKLHDTLVVPIISFVAIVNSLHLLSKDNTEGDISSGSSKRFSTTRMTTTTTTSTSASKANLFLRLPVELQRRIVFFLNPTDALSFTTSNVLLGKVNVSALHPIPLVSLNVSGSRDSGDIPQPYEPRIKPSSKISNIHSISVRAQWKDQGWGNRKGMLYIVATPTIKKLSNTTVETVPLQDEASTNDDRYEGGRVVTMTTTCAPHDWEQVELSFSPVDGEVYDLWYSVGGGGGHELCLKDAEVQTFYFDNQQLTYQKTFECLFNVGCVGSKIAQAPIRPNGQPRFTQITANQLSRRTPIYFGEKRPQNNACDLFYPNMLLAICKSITRHQVASNTTDEKFEVTSNEFLDPLIALLSDYGIHPNHDTMCAIEEFIQTDIDERNLDWDIYETKCRNLRKRLDLDENFEPTTDDRNLRMRIPIELQNATINGFRIVLPRDGRGRGANVHVPANNNRNVPNNDDENEEGNVDVDENGVRIEPILPAPVDPENHDDGAIPQVVNNPDGTVSINLGNLENLAANAVPIDFGNVPNNNIDPEMDVEEPEAALGDDETQEMFGIARAAMAAVFGFQNNENANDGVNNMNGLPDGFQNFFPQGNFVGGRGGNGGMFVGNNPNIFGTAFQFQNFVDLNNDRTNNVPHHEQQALAEPTNDHVMTDNEDIYNNDDDDDVEEIPIM